MSTHTRFQKRLPDALRPVHFQIGIAPQAMGSVLVSFGKTQVICAVSIEPMVPRWMKEQSVSGGWLTAEYSMLPYATSPRKNREHSREKLDGRSVEIQRLIGRALRAVIDLEALGPRTLWIDCDVLQADGGTRTAAITGSSLAVALACRQLVAQGKLSHNPMKQLVAAVSVGIYQSKVLLDLDYTEDRDADVDLNLVMSEALEFIEIQAAGEQHVFHDAQLATMITYGRQGIMQLLQRQKEILQQKNLDS